MATVSTIAVTQGSGTNVATYQFTDTDSTVKQLQRITLADDTGAEKGVTANPVVVGGTVTENLAADAAMTITLASLASSTAGVGRQSTLLSNTTNLYSSALVYCQITVGTTPTANTPIYVYLIRDNGDGTTHVVDDGAGASDAALTVVNAQLLGTIFCPVATSNVAYYGVFDTSLLGPLGPKWGIAIVNSTGVALNSTSGNHAVTYVGLTKSL